MLTIFKLFLIGLIPVIAAALIRYIDKYTKFKKIVYIKKQIIIGLIFGALSVIGSEFGVKSNGVIINVRDASPIIAGLIFGGPAGIIAGIIGGVERFISVYWNNGYATRWACSISTILAGFFAAIIRKLVFDNHHAKWYYGFFAGVFIEDFHMLMVFFTKMNDVASALKIVSACAIPMILTNSMCICIAMISTSLISKEPLLPKENPKTVSTKIQVGLLLSIILAFALVSSFTYSILTNLSKYSTENNLKTNIEDIEKEIDDNNLDYAIDNFNESFIPNFMILNIKNLSVDELNEKLFDICDGSNVKSISVIKDDKYYSSSDEALIGCDYQYKDNENYISTKGSNAFITSSIVSSDDGTIDVFRRQSDYIVLYRYEKDNLKVNVDNIIKDLIQNRHVGETGYLLLLDSDKTILNDDYIEIKDSIKNVAISENTLAKTSEDSYFGDYYYYMDRYYDYYIITLESVFEADLNMNTALYVSMFMEIIVFYSMYILIYVMIGRIVVKPIMRINRSLEKITYGDLNERIKEADSFEMKSLSDDINETVGSLKEYTIKEQEKAKEELNFAKEIQHSSLPSTFPAFPNNYEFDIYASMDTAKEVGGDFYDFYLLDSKHLCILIADVSGKGVPAAMFMMQSKTIIKNLMETGIDVATCFTVANNKLSENNTAQMFVTAWIGVLDLETGKLEFANAGHNPPIIKHDGVYEYLKSRPGLVLAGMEGIRYRMQEVMLSKGDEIYLYTDGVTEAMNNNSNQFSEERLLNSIKDTSKMDAEDTCKYIKNKVLEFVDGYEQSDDITMLNLKYYGIRDNKEFIVDAKTESIEILTSGTEEFLTSYDIPMKTLISINVAIDEIASNIINYGYKDIDNGKIKETIIKDENKVIIRFTDTGIEYNPLLKEDPDVTLSLDDRKEGGLGIFMVKKMMDEITYKYENGRNVLTIKKNI